jgi:hypothetical protein
MVDKAPEMIGQGQAAERASMIERALRERH